MLFWITQIATFLDPGARRQHRLRRASRGSSSIIAQDGYLPRQMANRGDKLVFSNGIIFLAVVAGLLIVVFKGNITALIPLYAFGVFTGFTLSQAGMVVHHFRHKDGRWRGSALINGVGCVATGLVALVVVVSKFTAGAWIPAVFIPVLVVFFRVDRAPLPQGARRGAGRAGLQAAAPHPHRRRARRHACTGASSTPSSTPASWRPTG